MADAAPLNEVMSMIGTARVLLWFGGLWLVFYLNFLQIQ
jgi:hypothetical protein